MYIPLCWDEIGERELTGPEIIQDAAEKDALIKRRLETAASRQKSYADSKRRDVEFQVGDCVCESVTDEGCDEVWQEGKVSTGKHWTF